MNNLNTNYIKGEKIMVSLNENEKVSAGDIAFINDNGYVSNNGSKAIGRVEVDANYSAGDKYALIRRGVFEIEKSTDIDDSCLYNNCYYDDLTNTACLTGSKTLGKIIQINPTSVFVEIK